MATKLLLSAQKLLGESFSETCEFEHNLDFSGQEEFCAYDLDFQKIFKGTKGKSVFVRSAPRVEPKTVPVIFSSKNSTSIFKKTDPEFIGEFVSDYFRD